MNKLIFKINYNGKYEDNFVVSGETIKEIGEKTLKELKRRNWKREDCTSEQLDLT